MEVGSQFNALAALLLGKNHGNFWTGGPVSPTAVLDV
jgi:hypothetical protein